MRSCVKGFSLIELLIVIAIIGILASIALLSYGPMFERTRAAQAYAVLSQIVGAEKRYYIENDAYTNVITDLDSFDTSIPVRDFTYVITTYTGANANKSYAEAQRVVGHGANSYLMCLNNSKSVTCAGVGVCAANQCP